MRLRERWVGALQQSKSSLKMIFGLTDPVSGSQVISRYRELIDDADIYELDRIGHYPQLESPQATLQAKT